MAASITAAREPQQPGAETDQSAASLKRRYKLLEQNHRDWQEQVQKDIRRQTIEIESLKRDKEQFSQQLNEVRVAEAATGVVGSGSLANPNSKVGKRSKEMDDKREQLSRLDTKMRNQTATVHELENEIDSVRQQTRVARRTRDGVNVTKESHDKINMQVQVLENRLDQSLQKFNEVLMRNKELRDAIDTLRGERDVFDEIYQKLEAELQEKKKEMAFIIEVSNIAFEERDNNLQVLENLKVFAQEEMDSFAETFKELDELLEEDRKMKEKVKGRIAQLEKKEREAGGGDESGRTGAAARRKAQSAAAKAAAAQSANKDGTDGGKSQADSAQAQIALYEDTFMKIRQHTDIPDLNELVQRFIHAEEDNFSLYSFMNDLTKETEALETRRAELLQEIDAIQMGDENDQERRHALRQLEDKLRAEEQKNQKYSELSMKTESLLRNIISNVEHTFNRLDCDESIIIQQHGIPGVTLDNLLLYLAAVELRTDEYLVAWLKQNGALSAAGGDGFGTNRGPQVPYDSMQVTVDPKKLPGTGEDAEGSDDDDHPLTREELVKKAQARLTAQAIAASERKTVRGGKPQVNKMGLGLVKKGQ